MIGTSVKKESRHHKVLWKLRGMFRTQSNIYRNIRHEVLYEIGVLKNLAKFTGKHLCQRLLLIKLQALAYNFIKKERLWDTCKFCQIFKNSFFIEYLRTTASIPKTAPFAKIVNFLQNVSF